MVITEASMTSIYDKLYGNGEIQKQIMFKYILPGDYNVYTTTM